MTDELQAAIDRVASYLDALARMNHDAIDTEIHSVWITVDGEDRHDALDYADLHLILQAARR